MIFLKLFFEFFKTGLFSIGGGLATLPFLFKMAEKYGWFTANELTAMIAVAESTPGPIGVNVATYAGFKTAGILGGITATLSLVLPSLIVILIIAGFLDKFRSNKIVDSVFFGLRPAVVGLISVSVMTLFETTFVNKLSTVWYQFIDVKKAVLFAIITFLVFRFKKHPILYIALGAVVGICLSL
ncbi:MAG: chromate transporter [Clostridia bacterium]|nr:chromate transporter [Clostridia bacterium]